jgi:hypothetical protein
MREELAGEAREREVKSLQGRREKERLGACRGGARKRG